MDSRNDLQVTRARTGWIVHETITPRKIDALHVLYHSLLNTCSPHFIDGFVVETRAFAEARR